MKKKASKALPIKSAQVNALGKGKKARKSKAWFTI
jgi:hypothetical protein